MKLQIKDLEKPFSTFWLGGYESLLSRSAKLTCYDGVSFVVWATYANHRGISVESKQQAISAARWLNRHRRKFLSKEHMHDLCGECCRGIKL